MDKKVDQLVAVTEDIKRLLVLALIKNGASQEDIGKALNIDQSSVSRLFPGGIRAKSAREK